MGRWRMFWKSLWIHESKPDYFYHFRVWQITAPDDYFLSQRLAGEGTLPQLRFGSKRGRVKFTRVSSGASVDRTVERP